MPSFKYFKSKDEKSTRNTPKIPGIPQSYLICFTKKRMQDNCFFVDARRLLEWAMQTVSFCPLQNCKN